MKNWYIGALGVVATLLLGSCGGGGGTPSTTPAMPAPSASVPQSSSMQHYAGSYSSACESVEGAVNLDLGGSVYARTISSVNPISEKVGAFSYRIDFFADAQCATWSLGSLLNSNPDSRVSIVGAAHIGGSLVDKVVLAIRPSSEVFTASATPGMVVFGTAIRLALPSFLFQAWEIKDLWRLENGRLYEGVLTEGPDGFPLDIDRSLHNVQVAVVPQKPAQPCASGLIEWTDGAAQCSAQIPVSLSAGEGVWINDLVGPTTGRASFSCVNGAWSSPNSTYCIDSTPPQSLCPEQTWTWTVNGNTCSGVVSAGSSNASAVNVVPGLRGAKQLSCVASPAGGFEWSEFIFAPTYPTVTSENCDVVVVLPPVTDPLQILKNKNCMLCHSVTNAEPGFLSFETIAAFYRDKPPASGVLESKIRLGGVGVFLDFPMPSNPHISDAELAIVVPWILSR